MQTTSIQWCHSTNNPVMGCDGCELWLSSGQVVRDLTSKYDELSGGRANGSTLKAVQAVIDGRELSQIYRDREAIAGELAARLGTPRATKALVDVVRCSAKCYAGLLGKNRAGQKGYADQFEEPKKFPGRMAEAANWRLPSPKDNAEKPWLEGLPRLIFISDMGDALSAGIDFEYLKDEIIANVASPKGQRHVWLWVTKRPGRMAQFGQWLAEQGVSWPHNLMAMTTVTSAKTIGRIAELRKVPSKLKGLSVEPLFGPVDLPLDDLDWVIVGGGSDVLAEPFHVEWSLNIREKCRAAGVAFFLKQLGKHPVYEGAPLKLTDKHGGEWGEWPEDWRVREMPAGFYELGLAKPRLIPEPSEAAVVNF